MATAAVLGYSPGSGYLCILISKLAQVLVSLDLVPSCGMKWAGHDIWSTWIHVHGNMVVTSADLSLFILGASQQPCTLHEWNVGFSIFSICCNSSPSRQWACLLCVGPQHWDAKSVAWPHCPGCISACIISIFLLVPCQKHSSQLMLFCCPTTLYVSFLKPSLYRSPLASFQLVSHGICSMSRCIAVYSWREEHSTSSVCHLDPSLSLFKQAMFGNLSINTYISISNSWSHFFARSTHK